MWNLKQNNNNNKTHKKNKLIDAENKLVAGCWEKYVKGISR